MAAQGYKCHTFICWPHTSGSDRGNNYSTPHLKGFRMNNRRKKDTICHSVYNVNTTIPITLINKSILLYIWANPTPPPALLIYQFFFLRHTLYQEFFLIFSLPIHISDNNICVQVWATKGLSLEETANLRQVELLQFFSS